MPTKAKARRSARKTARKTSRTARKTTRRVRVHAAASGAKEQFMNAMKREHETNLRVLRAYPADKLDLRPHARSKNAAELAWVFPIEQGLTEVALTKGFDWSKPMPASPPAPKSLDAIIKAYEVGHARIADLLDDMSEEELMETVKFPVAPKKLGDVPKIDFLWMLLSDQIHHRGQFSVYLRMAEAKVPSIYGPTADEPWM